LIVPNSVALIKKDKPNANAQAFLDYILSPETEKYLADIGWIQAPVRDVGLSAAGGVNWNQVRTIDVPLSQIYQQLEPSQTALKQIFVR